MKKLLILLALVATSAFAQQENQVVITQRNAADTGFLQRFLTAPASNADGLIYYNGTTIVPGYLTLGTGLSVTSGVLSCTAAGVQADWTASTGPSVILNKPTLATVATSGAYADLSGRPSLATVATSGAYADLTGKPTIPAAQVNSDWNAVSGLAQVLNKPSLATVATSGSYNDLTNKPTIPATPSQSGSSRSVNSGFQISSTRNALVFYSVSITVTASIAGGQSGDVILEIASDSGFTTNVQTVAIAGNSQTYTLAIALQGVQVQTGDLSGFVPAGYYTRLRTVNNTGAPTYSVRAGQEVLL